MGYDWASFFKLTFVPLDQATKCDADTNITDTITLYYIPFRSVGDKREFIYFCWESALWFYLMCKMKFVVHSRWLDPNSLDQLEKGISFQNIGMRDDIHWLQSVEYLPKDLNYRYTILTAVKALQEKTYFRFMTAFDIQVWVMLLATVIVISLLWAMYQEHKLDKMSGILDVVAPLFAEEFYKVKKLRRILERPHSWIKNYGLLLWLTLWFLMSWILSQCFSGQITTNLFQMKVYPIVENIEDLLRKKNIIIYTPYNENDMNWFKQTKPDSYEDLKNRIQKDNKLLQSLKDEKRDDTFWAKGISEGKYVFFQYEGFTQNMRHQYSGRFPNLYLSDHKYYYDPQALVVGRKHPYSKKLLLLFRIAFEDGLYIHQKMQTDKIFLGTFNTQVENGKFSMELEDKTLKLNVVLRGAFLLLAMFLPISFIIFLYELCEELPKIETKSKVKFSTDEEFFNYRGTDIQSNHFNTINCAKTQRRSSSMMLLYQAQFKFHH